MQRHSPRNLLACLGVALCAASSLAAAPLSDRHDKVALSSETDPFGELFGAIDGAVLNDQGLTTFSQGDPSFLSKIYQGTIAKVNRGIAQGTPAPSGGTFAGFSFYDVNASGQIAFTAFTGNTSGLFLASPAGIKILALKDAALPEGGGAFATFSDFFSVNDAGQVAFHATIGGGHMGEGIYLHTGSGVVNLVRSESGGGNITGFGPVLALNNAGQVAYTATITNFGPANGVYLTSTATGSRLLAPLATNDLSLNEAGQVAFVASDAIHLATPAGDTAIVSSGDDAPGGGTFASFDKAVLNNAGQVAFRANTTGGPGAGIYLWKPTGLKRIALLNAPLPGGAVLTSFGAPTLIDGGQVVFPATTAAGDVICLGDEANLLKVIGAGDSLLGVPITGVSLAAPGKVSGHGPVNHLAQVVYRANFSNGVTGIFIFTPSLHWRTAGSGEWDVAANWTAGIEPASVHDVAIDTAVAVTVTGPAANTAVRSLLVGGGASTSALDFQPGVTLATTAGLTLVAKGTLTGTGTIGGNATLLAGAHIALEIAGPTRGTDYDFLKVTGRAVLTGTLDVVVTNGLTLHGGDTFDLFDFGSRAGTFAAVHLPALPPGLTWDTSRLYTTGTISVSMATFFAANQGKYSGLVTADPEAPASSGSVALTLAQGGAFTGTLKMGGKSYALRGTLDDSGYFSGPLGTTGFSLILQLDRANSTDQIAATIKQNGAPFSAATLDRTQTGFTTKNPVPRAGTYTVTLPADPMHPEAAYPQGTGYGSLVVAPTGTVKLTGVLGDLTAFSPAGILSKNNEFAVYFPLYAGKGFISGVLTVGDGAAANAVEGTLHWFKPTNSSVLYPSGFAGDTTVAGSRYLVPPTPPSPPQILPPGAATFTISGGNVIVNPAVKNLTIGARNVVTVTPPEKFTLTITVKTGIFAGTFLDAANKSRSFKGVFLQKQNVGKGLFKGELQTGKIELQPQ